MLSACVIAVAASRWAVPAQAQPAYSARQGVTLIAIKPPSVEALHAVSVGTGARAADSFTIDVHDDGMCDIRVAAAPDAHAEGLQVLDLAGVARPLSGGPPVAVFRGRCRTANPGHAVRMIDERPPSATDESVALVITVVSGRGERIRRWQTPATLRLLPRAPR